MTGAVIEQVAAMDSINVQELKQRLDGARPVLLDVRNPPEAEVAVIPGAELIPLATIESGEVVERIRNLAAGKSLYVHKLGGAPRKPALLAGHGIDAINVAGGPMPGRSRWIPVFPVINRETPVIHAAFEVDPFGVMLVHTISEWTLARSK